MLNHRPLAPSLSSLLYKIIDYAGLFPPASLSLEEALRNYLRYRTLPESWMLSRFIIPATRLGELTRLINDSLTEPLTWEGCLRFSVLGQGGMDRTAFLTGLETDLEAIAAFRAEFGERVRLDVYETCLLGSEFASKPQVGKLLDATIPRLSEAGLSSFFETPFGTGWETRVGALIQALSETSAEPRGGFKLRTGGVTADAFPSPKQVAFALCACRDHQVSMKCTAGLHHPIRSYREEVGTKMHGFLNVFVAGVLAEAHALTEDEIVAVLTEEDATCFEFAVKTLQWRGIAVSRTQVEAMREKRLLSFGSCSFDEPVEDLSSLTLSWS